MSAARFLFDDGRHVPLNHRELFERRPITATRRTKRGPHEKRAFGDASRADASRDAPKDGETETETDETDETDARRHKGWLVLVWASVAPTPPEYADATTAASEVADGAALGAAADHAEPEAAIDLEDPSAPPGGHASGLTSSVSSAK